MGAGGAATSEEPIGLVVPSVSEVRIPRVEPSIYRIIDEVITEAGTMLTGVALVDVSDLDDDS